MPEPDKIQDPDSPNPGCSTTNDEVAAARFYEEVFVPALFAEWAPRLIDAAGVEVGDRVLDVACGTGVAVRAAAKASGSDALVTGLDLSAGMLQVARQLSPGVEWLAGDADTLSFPDASFNRVVCQFGLMFFADPVRALKEMRRVCSPGGRVAVAVWNDLAHNPGFSDKVDVLERLAGAAAADALRAPFCLGDRETLMRHASDARLNAVSIDVCSGNARFNSIAEFVDTELEAWLPVMGVELDAATKRNIHAECEQVHAHYVDDVDGAINLPTSAFILCASP